MPDQVDRDWTEEENYDLLTRSLRQEKVPSTCLVDIIRQWNISPPWFDMPLPPGRSVNECKRQFQALLQSRNPPAAPVRSAESWQAPPPPAGFQAYNPSPVNAPPLASSAQDLYASRKRPLYSAEKPVLPRAIQPRPPHSNVQYGHDAGSPGPMSPGWGDQVSGKGSEPPRKRGRPNKKETERRKAEAEARGESYPPPRRRLSKTKNPATPSGAASATSDSSMVSPMHVAHTPETQKQERRLETPAPRDMPAEQAPRPENTPSDGPDTDPVKGIIRSQSSQDRRLPLPHEFPGRRESFGSMRTSPREPPPLPQVSTFETPPATRPQEKTMHPPVEPRLLTQAQGGPAVHQSGGGYIPTAITQPGETKT